MMNDIAFDSAFTTEFELCAKVKEPNGKTAL